MEIEKIIYDTTREIYSIEDKLSIAVIFLFCEKISSEKFSELLYTENHKQLIESLSSEYSAFDVKFNVNFDNANVKNSFYKTLEVVKNKCDKDGFYKALFDKDPFAIVISEIVNYSFDKIEIKKITVNINKQLSLF